MPKDATHIEDLKHVIETFPHPNLEVVVGHQDTGGTIPVDSNVWEKLLGQFALNIRKPSCSV